MLFSELEIREKESWSTFMRKRWILFIIGAILFLVSLPLGTKMIMELIHEEKMKLDYEIIDVNEGFPATESTFNFRDHIIEIEETIKNEESYIDPWTNKIVIADLSVKLDGNEIDKLKNYPIRAEEEGLNRYHGEIAYLKLLDKKDDKTEFIILLKKTRELQKEMPNGDIVGWVPEEKLKYALYALDEEGNLEKSSFGFSERDALQTKLLNAGGVVPYSIGYYTDAWGYYPILFFPFSFPFLTLIIGFVLMLVFYPWKKVKNDEEI